MVLLWMMFGLLVELRSMLAYLQEFHIFHKTTVDHLLLTEQLPQATSDKPIFNGLNRLHCRRFFEIGFSVSHCVRKIVQRHP